MAQLAVQFFHFPLIAAIFGSTFYQLTTGSVKKINPHIGLIYNSTDFTDVISTCAERAVF